jgi:hypothetical protein
MDWKLGMTVAYLDSTKKAAQSVSQKKDTDQKRRIAQFSEFFILIF